MSKFHDYKYLTTERPCRRRKAKKPGSKGLPLPQLPEENRPSGWRWSGIAYVPSVITNKKGEQVDGYKCTYCGIEKHKQNTIQEHVVKHFPAKIKCLDCGDSFHLLTEYQSHFLQTCEFCKTDVRVGGWKAHLKTKKHIICEREAERCIRIEPERRPKLKLISKRTESE